MIKKTSDFIDQFLVFMKDFPNWSWKRKFVWIILFALIASSGFTIFIIKTLTPRYFKLLSISFALLILILFLLTGLHTNLKSQYAGYRLPFYNEKERKVGKIISVLCGGLLLFFIILQIYSLPVRETTIALIIPPTLQTASLDSSPTPTNLMMSTNTPSPEPSIFTRVGIIIGHWGDPTDSGSVCEDGLTELEVNTNIATSVQKYLSSKKIETELFKEFDPQLFSYQGVVLLSIHTDSCQYINDQATGFKLSTVLSRSNDDASERLVNCLADEYSEATHLPFHNSLTADMTAYHSFDEIIGTPIAIIDAGFLHLDREILTQKTDLVASGISEGLLCYIRNYETSLEEFSMDVIDLGIMNYERVTIENVTSNEINLNGWMLLDQHENTYSFGDFILSPGSDIIIYTHRPESVERYPSEYFWHIKESETWSPNEILTLLDEQGELRKRITVGN